MNISELLKQLSYGELSNLTLGSEGVGAIQADRRANVVHFVNEGLLRLYSRFVLREKDCILRLYEHITNYHFCKKFALTATTVPLEPIRYIEDTELDPFEDDLIRILSVRGPANFDLPLNDRFNIDSLFTPQPNILQVPLPVQDDIMVVVYQARHPLIDYVDTEACIELPIVLEGALRAYVAHLVYSNMNGQENAAKAMEYLQRYELICKDVMDQDLVNQSVITTNLKFHERGFI